MRALSIRQPWAELILRGIKTIEYRSRSTTIVGERFWIYASKGPAKPKSPVKVWSTDLVVPGAADTPLPWMVELANALRLFPEKLPTGVIVGSAVIEKVSRPAADAGHDLFQWHLTDVKRCDELRAPERHPQPVWFVPF